MDGPRLDAQACAARLRGQTAGVGTELLFENDRCRVWDLSLAPKQELGWHQHPLDCLIVNCCGGPNSPGKGRHGLRRALADAADSDVELFSDDRDCAFRPAGGGAERVWNHMEVPHASYIVELK